MTPDSVYKTAQHFLEGKLNNIRFRKVAIRVIIITLKVVEYIGCMKFDIFSMSETLEIKVL